MNPDDIRHGTSAGYIAGCRGECCWRAKQRYDKSRRWELLSTGQYRKRSNVGSIRRIQALQAIGWSVPQIAKRVDVHPQHIYNLHRHVAIYVSTAEKIAAAYEEMAMVLPPQTTTGERISAVRARNHAKRRGWLPPLAWVEIDDPNEQPDMDAVDTLPDPVVVERILSGDWRLKATPVERAEVIARWSGSLNELERQTGWNVAREKREGVAA